MSDIAWKSLAEELGVQPPAIVACMVTLFDNLEPLTTSNGKIVIFLKQDEAKKFVESDLMPKTAEDRVGAQLLASAYGRKYEPALMDMGQENWNRFQRENPGQYRVFSSAKEASQDMDIKLKTAS